MPRSTHRRVTSTTELSQAQPVPPHATETGADRLREVLRARRAPPSPARPSFRDRLEAWLEEEL